MDERENIPPRFARNPRSIPLYVPPERSLPLWPAAWTLGTLARVAFFAILGGAGLAAIIIGIGAYAP
jgi:hypothetical protein